MKTRTKVHEFKLKVANNAKVPKLSNAELREIVLWATAAAKVIAILQRGDKIEMKFDDEFTVERTKILPELYINNIVKILSLEKQYTLVTLNRTPLQADDAEITDYLSKFGTLKGPIKRRTYTEGPLKGIENGTITALISLETPIPSYHWLQGKRFEAYHKGMVKTCNWCLERGEKCKNFMLGNGSACKASGTQKSSFKDFISNLWNNIEWDENKYNENNESSQTATGLPATGRERVENKQDEKDDSSPPQPATNLPTIDQNTSESSLPKTSNDVNHDPESPLPRCILDPMTSPDYIKQFPLPEQARPFSLNQKRK